MRTVKLGNRHPLDPNLAFGIGSILAVFVLPGFVLKLGILTGGAWCVGSAIMPRVLGRERARNLGLALLLLGSTVLVSLVVGEYLARVTFADVTTTPDNRSYFARKWSKTLSFNSLGYREREITVPKPEGIYRIAVIGDSFTWGQGIAVTDRMTERLESMLRSEGLEVEVLNFGHPGDETVDHVRTLKDVVLPVEPDFVLMQWYINDVEGRDKSSRPPVHRLIPSDESTKWLRSHSALFDVVDHAWLKLQWRVGLSEPYLHYMDRRFSDPTSHDMVAAESALREFISTARAAGVGVGVVAFPHIVPSKTPEDFPLAYLMDRVSDICAAEGVDCVDLRRELLNVSGTGWFANRLDPHPGPRTNEVAAKAVAEEFAERWKTEASH